MKVGREIPLALLLVLVGLWGGVSPVATAVRSASGAAHSGYAYDSAASSTTPTSGARAGDAYGETWAGGVARTLMSASAIRLAAKGAGVLPKPLVDNPKLGNIVDDLYKGTTNPNRVGTRTTADAIRNEAATGLPTGGRFHAQKGVEYERALGNFLRRNPDASYRDRLTAQSLLDDLISARGGR